MLENSHMRSWLAACVLVGVTMGCNPAPRKLKSAEKFQGNVVKADNTPLGNLRVILQPTGDGYEIEIDVDEKGTFQGEGIPGKYIYYFAPSKNSKPATMKDVPQDYHEPKMEHSVLIQANSEVICKIGEP